MLRLTSLIINYNIGYYLLVTYFVQSALLSKRYNLSPLNLTTTAQCKYYYFPHLKFRQLKFVKVKELIQGHTGPK